MCRDSGWDCWSTERMLDYIRDCGLRVELTQRPIASRQFWECEARSKNVGVAMTSYYDFMASVVHSDAREAVKRLAMIVRAAELGEAEGVGKHDRKPE